MLEWWKRYVLPSLVYLPTSANLAPINALNERSLHLESFEGVDGYTVDLLRRGSG
ncbi:MAG: hypothetical protein ABSD31_21350 [Candidatus Binataceae bacterium]|jgi:hypothetical protein